MKKRLLGIGLSMILALGLAGCGSDQSTSTGATGDGEKIYIGMAVPLTGDSAMYGETVRDGVAFAVSELNENGGIDGKQIELIIQDDKGDPQEAAMVAQKLVENKNLLCVIGHVNSSCTLAALPIYDEAGITLMNTSSSAEKITQLGYKNFFRTLIHDGLQAPMMVRHAVENLGLTEIACIVANSDYGLGLLEGTKEEADRLGATIVASEMYVPLTDKDFSVQLSKIKQSNPNVLLILGDYNEAGLIIRQMEAAGLGDIDVVTPAACSNQIMIDLAGAEAAEGVYMLGYWDTERPEPIVKNFVDAFEAKNGEKPDERNAYGYEIPYILKQAVEENGATRENLPEVLRSIEFVGPTGLTKFDENGDVTEKMQMVFIITDGRFTSWVQ